MDGFWAFFWLAVVLKIPIVALLYIIWWAIHQTDAEVEQPDDGGGSDRHSGDPRKRPPRPPRRGPHAEPPPRPPERVRAKGERRAHPAEPGASPGGRKLAPNRD